MMIEESRLMAWISVYLVVTLRIVGDGGGDGFSSGVVIVGAGRSGRRSGVVDCRSVAAWGGTLT